MKAIILSIIVISLMLGAQSVYAALDIYGKPIIFTDGQGRPCTFGPSHDECLYQHLQKIPGTTNYRDYHSGFKVGNKDGLNDGIYHHKYDNIGASWGSGYTDGWSQGCLDSGRTQDDCDNQEDVSTP